MNRFVVGVLLFVATGAAAQGRDARALGLAGIEPATRSAAQARVNPALRAVPRTEAPRERAIPIPLGLLQVDWPSFDVDDEDFDPYRVANVLWSPPINLQFGEPSQSAADRLFDLALASESLDLATARALIGESDFASGSYAPLFEVASTLDLGTRFGVLHLSWLEGFVVHRIDGGADDDLAAVLFDGASAVDGRVYRVDTDGRAQTGLSTSLSYAREIPLPGGADARQGDDWLDAYWDGERDRPRLWIGFGVRRYHGLYGADLDARLDLLAQGEIFEVDAISELRTATPDGIGGLGSAWGLDLGAVLRWRTLEFGAGVADLLADMQWSKAKVQRFEVVDGATTRTTVGEEEDVEIPLPRRWRMEVLHRDGLRRTVGVALHHGPGGTSAHLGAEEWTRSWLALRAGLQRDARGLLQFGLGTGFRVGSVGLDVGLASHARGIDDDRLLELGVAVVVGTQPR